MGHRRTHNIRDSCESDGSGGSAGKKVRKRKAPALMSPVDKLPNTNTERDETFAPLKCPICSEHFFSELSLEVHVISLHPGKEIRCEDCSHLCPTYNYFKLQKLKREGPVILFLLSFALNKGMAVKCYAEGELARDCPNPKDICYTKQAADHAEENLKSRGCTSLAVVERQFGKNFGINSCFQPRAGTFDCWCDQDKCNESKETACQTCSAISLLPISTCLLTLIITLAFL